MIIMKGYEELLVLNRELVECLNAEISGHRRNSAIILGSAVFCVSTLASGELLLLTPLLMIAAFFVLNDSQLRRSLEMNKVLGEKVDWALKRCIAEAEKNEYTKDNQGA